MSQGPQNEDPPSPEAAAGVSSGDEISGYAEGNAVAENSCPMPPGIRTYQLRVRLSHPPLQLDACWFMRDRRRSPVQADHSWGSDGIQQRRIPIQPCRGISGLQEAPVREALHGVGGARDGDPHRMRALSSHPCRPSYRSDDNAGTAPGNSEIKQGRPRAGLSSMTLGGIAWSPR